MSGLEQLLEVVDAAQALACDRPQILGGDFNAPYCGAPELDVLRGAGFVDAVGKACEVSVAPVRIVAGDVVEHRIPVSALAVEDISPGRA